MWMMDTTNQVTRAAERARDPEDRLNVVLQRRRHRRAVVRVVELLASGIAGSAGTAAAGTAGAGSGAASGAPCAGASSAARATAGAIVARGGTTTDDVETDEKRESRQA